MATQDVKWEAGSKTIDTIEDIKGLKMRIGFGGEVLKETESCRARRRNFYSAPNRND